MNTVEIGKQIEKLAQKYLIDQEILILTTNYHCLFGEIDIIAIDQQKLVFIEVRYRSSDKFGSAIESVDHFKQQRIIRSAQHFLNRHHANQLLRCRFDVIGITKVKQQYKFKWIRDAFCEI